MKTRIMAERHIKLAEEIESLKKDLLMKSSK